MPVPALVTQLRFSRAEFTRCLQGVDDQDAVKRLEPMNCISWIIGHLANQENRYWVEMAQGVSLEQVSGLNNLVGYGKPASTPPLTEMQFIWESVTQTADGYLNTLTSESLLTHLDLSGKPYKESIGTMLYRNIYHYWFHTGEAHAIRQGLGHTNLPQFVGDISSALFRPD